LDGLRAVAVVMVFVHHAFHAPLLWAGVDLFFILSGYLITDILLRDSERMGFRKMLGRFYWRRAVRILPAYVLALVLLYPLVHVELRKDWYYYAFFLQNVPFAFRLIPWSALMPMWSLAVEQHFYLVWPVLVYFLPRQWLTPVLVVIVVGSPLLRWVCTPLFSYPEAIYTLTPFRLDDMAFGALAAVWLPRCNAKATVHWAQGSMVVGAVAYGLLSVHPWFRRGANTAVFNSLAYSLDLVVLGGLFVWAAMAERTWLARMLSSAPLRGLGRISYMFYLLHLGVLIVVFQYFGAVTGTAVAFVVTAALATVSWFALERPVLSMSRSHRRP
jgi:peptidoglycan/LPS O-acetylase OafA/YrhL